MHHLSSKRILLITTAVLGCSVFASHPRTTIADEFTLVDEKGQESTIEAELVGSDDDWHALAVASGEYRLVPQAAIRKRTPKEGPTPLTANEMAKQLEQEYGSELFRSGVLGNYVVGLVLSTPLPKASEGKAKAVLDRATRFMKQVETAFATFLKEARIVSNKPKYPQVMLIFETDDEFDKYTEKITQQRGLKAQMIAGFYSGLTNVLAIRLEECSSFDTPFHEAIHQQVYNCGLLQRLSPVPQWFDEGIATGFEAAKGKVVAHPTRVSPRYAMQALEHNRMSWKDMHTRDDVFRGDVLASEAYGQAWGLHWLLITKYKTEYNAYLKRLSEKSALATDTPEERESDFTASFKKSMAEMEKEFPNVLQLAIKKQKVKPDPPSVVGLSQTEADLAIVTMTAVSKDGNLRVEGKLQNISPLRPMSFIVVVVTDAGEYAMWFQDNVTMSKTVPLAAQLANLRLPGTSGIGAGRTFRVLVRSAPSNSPKVEEWRTKRDDVLTRIMGSRRATNARSQE